MKITIYKSLKDYLNKIEEKSILNEQENSFEDEDHSTYGSE